MEDILFKMGFTKDPNGKFFHKILNRSFDFSANSLEGIPCKIFSDGADVGAMEAQATFRQAIGIE